MNAEDVKSRVKAVLTENHITANSLANTFGVNQKTLHNQINDSAAIGLVQYY
jgi:plasmid maintenance system antidote protein VapI